MTEPHALSLTQAVSRLQSRELTASRLLGSCLERIGAREPTVGAWQEVDERAATDRAAQLDRGPIREPLHGIPVGVKDIIDVAGLPTRHGSKHAAHHRSPSQDAWVVAQMRSAGAVVLGKTVTTEFAYFAPGGTSNPRDVNRTPGGSSSGSAAAVADAMVPLALGTQTAASTTRPAAFCGIAGLVTTPEIFESAGIRGLSPTLDSLGFLTREIDDLHVVLAALEGGSVSTSSPEVRPARLRLFPGHGIAPLDREMVEAVEAAARSVAAAGAVVDGWPVSGQPRELVELHVTVMAYEAARALAQERRAADLSPQLGDLLAQGDAVSEETYRSALRTAHQARLSFLRLLDGYDAMLTPAASGPAPLGLGATGDPSFSRPWQVLGLPSVTIPGMTDSLGLPLGLQLVGRPGAELALLRTASWVASHMTGPDGR